MNIRTLSKNICWGSDLHQSISRESMRSGQLSARRPNERLLLFCYNIWQVSQFHCDQNQLLCMARKTSQSVFSLGTERHPELCYKSEGLNKQKKKSGSIRTYKDLDLCDYVSKHKTGDHQRLMAHSPNHSYSNKQTANFLNPVAFTSLCWCKFGCLKYLLNKH